MNYVRLTPGLLALASQILACSPPKQAAPPEFEDTGGQDITVEEEKEIAPAAKMPDEMSAAEKHKACCQQCAKGMAADRTGESAEKIPCVDFTSVLNEWCLEHFRKAPAMASECASEAPAADPAGSAAPAGSATPSDTDFLRGADMKGGG